MKETQMEDSLFIGFMCWLLMALITTGILWTLAAGILTGMEKLALWMAKEKRLREHREAERERLWQIQQHHKKVEQENQERKDKLRKDDGNQ